MARRGNADLHLHTSFSDGWPTPVQLVDHVVASTQLDVIAVTDHDTIEGARRAQEHAAALGAIEVIVGEEVTSRHGHILGLFLTRRVKPGMTAAATICAIHDQGGLAIAAHPFWRTQALSDRWGGSVHGVGWAAAELEFDAVEVENSTPGLGFSNLLARRLADGAGVPKVGGSDAHILDAVERAWTSFPGRTPAALRGAIERGTCRPHAQRYGTVALMRYAAWGFNHRRAGSLAVAR